MGFENFSQNENIPQPKIREEMITLLRDKGIEDADVLESLKQYERTLEQLSYTAESGYDEAPRVAIHMAEIYFEAGYKDEAILSLHDILGFDPDTGVEYANLNPEVKDEVYDALEKMADTY